MPPFGTKRRKRILAANALFTGCYFTFACSSVVLLLQSYPLIVWGVLAFECGSMHAVAVTRGEWATDDVGVPLWMSGILRTAFWLSARFCPFWTIRMPMFMGPSSYACTIACGLVESAGFAALALFSGVESRAHEQHLMVIWSVCVPAGCVALTALVVFVLAVEPCFRA
eukprot:5438687-Prymnesium_polylepis.1